MPWAPDYTTVAKARAYLRIGDTDDDVLLTLAITTASRAIDRAAGGRQFGRLDAPATWLYTPTWDRVSGRWVAKVDDIGDTTGLVVAVDGVATTDYTLLPKRAIAKGKAHTAICLGASVGCSGDLDCVAATVRWGWPAVPVAIEEACLLQTSRMHARRDSPYGVAGSPTDGSEMRLLATVDPDVRVAIGPYTRVWAVA